MVARNFASDPFPLCVGESTLGIIRPVPHLLVPRPRVRASAVGSSDVGDVGASWQTKVPVKVPWILATCIMQCSCDNIIWIFTVTFL